MRRSRSSSVLIPAIGVALLASACSSSHGEEGGQVFAVVDGTEITAPMLDVALSSLPPGMNPKDAAVQKAVLDQVVNETLLAGEAEDMKLDRTPAVRRAVEAAERGVLAQSYLDHGVSTAPATDTEVVGFFSDHPYLFADRRRYDLDVIQVRGTAVQVRPYVAAFSGGGVKVADIGDRMTRDGIAVTVDRDRMTGDQMPERVAQKLASAAPGDVVTYRVGDVQKFVQVAGVEASPVPLALARPTIAQFLLEQRRRTQMAANLKRVRQAAKVEYRGLGKSIMAGGKGAAPMPTPPRT